MADLTDFFGSGGGGGLTPKFQEFNSSGTFTPSAALIAAGGYIEVFLVAGAGGGGNASTSYYYGRGGEVRMVKMYLTSVADITITIGGGGIVSSQGEVGSPSTFLGSSAGGEDITANGGAKGNQDPYPSYSPSWMGGDGLFGYGASGNSAATNTTGPYTAKPNTGQGGRVQQGASGYCLIKWYE